MDAFTEKLLHIMNNIDGSCESAYCGYDGMIIARHILISTPLDVEMICANFVSIIKTLKTTGNNPKDILTSFENHTLYLKILEEGFVLIIMNADGNLGRAKLECSKLPKNLVG